MKIGWTGNLYFLAFDHRGTFYRELFGIEGNPTADQVERIARAKRVVYDGAVRVLESGAVVPGELGILVDEQSGTGIARDAHARGLRLAMPAELSGQAVFTFQYGDEFGDHIAGFDAEFTKVLVRHNPGGDADGNRVQLERLRTLADWLHDHDRRFLFELVVPPTDAQLADVGGDSARYDVELRPGLMLEAMREVHAAGIDVDVWKIEGLDDRADAEALAAQARSGPGREDVVCILLGRGAGNDVVDHWLREAAVTDGFAGFAIGRSIWWDALKAHVGGEVDRDQAVSTIADRFARFIDVYTAARAAGASAPAV
jgi:5-dehydro-2-deoxygluconokinase